MCQSCPIVEFVSFAVNVLCSGADIVLMGVSVQLFMYLAVGGPDLDKPLYYGLNDLCSKLCFYWMVLHNGTVGVTMVVISRGASGLVCLSSVDQRKLRNGFQDVIQCVKLIITSRDCDTVRLYSEFYKASEYSSCCAVPFHSGDPCLVPLCHWKRMYLFPKNL